MEFRHFMGSLCWLCSSCQLEWRGKTASSPPEPLAAPDPSSQHSPAPLEVMEEHQRLLLPSLAGRVRGRGGTGARLPWSSVLGFPGPGEGERR